MNRDCDQVFRCHDQRTVRRALTGAMGSVYQNRWPVRNICFVAIDTFRI